jgi:hypothetical protein
MTIYCHAQLDTACPVHWGQDMSFLSNHPNRSFRRFSASTARSLCSVAINNNFIAPFVHFSMLHAIFDFGKPPLHRLGLRQASNGPNKRGPTCQRAAPHRNNRILKAKLPVIANSTSYIWTRFADLSFVKSVKH